MSVLLLLLHAPRSNTGHELPVYAMRFVANKRQRTGASIFHLPVPTLWCYFLVPVALSVVTDFASRQHYVRYPPSTARHHTTRYPLIFRTPPPPSVAPSRKGCVVKVKRQRKRQRSTPFSPSPVPSPLVPKRKHNTT